MGYSEAYVVRPTVLKRVEDKRSGQIVIEQPFYGVFSLNFVCLRDGQLFKDFLMGLLTYMHVKVVCACSICAL